MGSVQSDRVRGPELAREQVVNHHKTKEGMDMHSPAPWKVDRGCILDANGDFPAFPTWEMGGQGPEPSCDGLTKREWFAAMAMQGLLARLGAGEGGVRNGIAFESVKMADLVISQLNATPSP